MSAELSGSLEDRLRVLLVEDSPAAAATVERRLEEGNGNATALHHIGSLEGVETLLEEPWDVVLLDLGLPGCEGLDALARVREAAPDLPIVVLTAHDDDELAMRALEAEAQDYLVKKRIDTDSLMRAIRYAIGRQQIHARLARAVAEARASEARLRELTARSSDGILVVALDGRVLFSNPASAALLGKEEEELLGSRLTTVDLTKDREELVTTAADGSRRFLDIRSTDLEWKGEAARLMHIRDVTELRRAEDLRLQLERSGRLAAVGQLAAGVAHEINNPLTYVTVHLDLARKGLRRMADKGVDVGSILERLRDAREGASRVVRIVRDLGMFARVDSEGEQKPVDINQAVESALSMAATHIKHRAEVRRELADVPWVTATEGRLSQVFLNLLVNAAQAIDPIRA